MKNEIQEFVNEKLGLKVRCVQNEDGSISVNIGDAAIGLGMIKRDYKKGKEYIRPNMSGINSHLKSFGISDSEKTKDDYLHESYIYLLAMKASNPLAQKFQMWLATEVIPSIRKHGAFIADSENVDEKYVLNELKFSQKRTIKTFANADVNEIKKLYDEFKEYVDSEYKYKSSDRLARYKSVEKGLQQLHDRLAKEDISNVGDCYNIRKLKEKVVLDRTTLEKRIGGGIRAAKTKEIASLKGSDSNE